jgi:Kef-type K+ transport system membrane component KefB
MTFPSEHDFALFLFQLFLILSLALALGGLFRRLGQPAVIGEIFAGILLGPSVLGAWSPKAASALFPPAQTHMLGTLAWLGSVFLLLVAGTEVNLTSFKKERRVVLTTSLAGIAVPFAAGLVLGLYLPAGYLPDQNRRWLFAFFLATAMSISSIPLIAKILMDLNLLKTPVGHVIIGSAVVNDLIGWVFFAIILSLMTGGVVAGGSLVTIIVVTLAFSLICLTFGKDLLARLFSYTRIFRLPPQSTLGLAVLIAFFCASFTQWIGIHAIFGAFLAGVMIGETDEITNHTRDALRDVVLYVFAPIFFASMGQRANFLAHFDLVLVSVTVAVTCASKVSGGTLGAALGGFRSDQAVAVGFGLNTQGVMQIILAFVALEYALITERVFVALVFTALVTSVMSGPLIQWAMQRHLARA